MIPPITWYLPRQQRAVVLVVQDFVTWQLEFRQVLKILGSRPEWDQTLAFSAGRASSLGPGKGATSGTMCLSSRGFYTLE